MSRMMAYQEAKLALEAAEAACVSGSECELEVLDKATSDFEAVGGYTVEKRVTLVLSGLGFEMDEFDKPCSSFSGGWQMRIGLGRLLLTNNPALAKLVSDTGAAVACSGGAKPGRYCRAGCCEQGPADSAAVALIFHQNASQLCPLAAACAAASRGRGGATRRRGAAAGLRRS